MKYKLSKRQVDMLIEGKELRAGTSRLAVNEKAKEDLKNWKDNPIPGTAIYYDSSSIELYIDRG